MQTIRATYHVDFVQIGRRAVQAARARSGLSIAEAARRIDVSIMEYFNLEQGFSRLAEEAYPTAIALLDAPRSAET